MATKNTRNSIARMKVRRAARRRRALQDTPTTKLDKALPKLAKWLDKNAMDVEASGDWKYSLANRAQTVYGDGASAYFHLPVDRRGLGYGGHGVWGIKVTLLDDGEVVVESAPPGGRMETSPKVLAERDLKSPAKLFSGAALPRGRAASRVARRRRRRVAWSLNAASTSLKNARAYAEEQFERAGQSIDEVLPDFDRNYKLLQNKLRKALDVPRIQMPVIEPSDINLFNKRLNQGQVDIFRPWAKGKFHMPESLGGGEAEEWITLGFQDGVQGDDVIKGKLGSVPVKKLLPTQSQIWFDKLIENIIKYGPPKSGSPVLSKTIIVSKDGYILDGHHRFGQAILADPSLQMKALTVPLPIEVLLKVGKTYGEAIGNRPKASIQAARRTTKEAKIMQNEKIARELVRLTKELTGAERTMMAEEGGLETIGGFRVWVDSPIQREKVEKAVALANSKSALKRRLNEAKSLLRGSLKAEFGKGELDFTRKRLVSDDGTMAIQWVVRTKPEEPESYRNQQTTVGTVKVLRLR